MFMDSQSYTFSCEQLENAANSMSYQPILPHITMYHNTEIVSICFISKDTNQIGLGKKCIPVKL